MASRQLRKLRKQQELLRDTGPVDESSDDEPIQVAKPRVSAFSAFAALGNMGNGDDDDDDDVNDGAGSPNPGAQSAEEEGKPGPALSDDGGQPSKKKKKPKKKKKKGKKPTDSAAADAAVGEEAIDDIDKALEELKVKDLPRSTAASSSPAATASATQLRNLLRINFQHLKAMNEMRKLFGKAIDTADSEASSPPPRRNMAEGVDLETYLRAPPTVERSKHAMFDSLIRSNPFVEGKKTWPRGSALGLKMAVVSSDKATDAIEYTYSHDKQYDELEFEFFQRVGTYDPMAIDHFLYRHPYHISSLIQASKVAIQDQNSALAADLIERALFSFGRVSLRDFRNKLEVGRVYMDFARPENRQFYLAGWNLIHHLSLKGTFRTALEWSKLFLSINHEDPYGMVNWVHALAIRAHQAQWFLDLCRTDMMTGETALPSSLYVKQTRGLAYLQLGNRELAKSVITTGVESCPWMYSSLFRALDIDCPPSIWDWPARNPDETAYTELYIHMTKDLWSAPDTMALLLEAARAAKRPQVLECPLSPRFTPSAARFVYLTNDRELISSVPPGMLNVSPNYDFDPLPPPEQENKFTSPAQQLAWRAAEDDGDEVPGLAPFLNDPRVRAAFRARRAALHGDPNGRPVAGEQDHGENEQFDEQFRALEAGEDAEDVNLPPDRRGFLGRVIALLVPHLLSDPQLPPPTLEEISAARNMSQMPGHWSDDFWEDEDDEFEGSDDFFGRADEDDDDLPPFEPMDDNLGGGDAESLRQGTPPRPFQATVEDVGEEEDDQGGSEQQQGRAHRT